ncbi:MAG: RNA polymerase factor sigma-54, partial [Burkholderiales bacterium]
MGPAIALRLRQHLTLTPQVQQALKLLQMSAMEFAQEMEQALAANPFLEENQEAPPAAPRDGASVDDVIVPQETSGGAPLDRDQDEWGSLNEAQPTLSQHLREQLMILPMNDRDRALAHMIIDSLEDDGYFKVSFDELLPLVAPEADLRAEDFGPALKLVQSLDPAGVGARSLEECLLLQLQALPATTPERDVAMRIVKGHLSLLANREWARLQHAAGCDEAALHRARALIRSLDPRPGHRFGAQEARYVVPDVLVKKMRDRWVALINPASLPRVRLNRAYADAIQNKNASNQSLARHLQEARWLLRSIEQRFATIQRVADAIVARQRGFFEYGEVAMKPLTLKLIAGELGLHESTVCRVTNNKYMATPRGLFEFKHFFSRRLATENGGAASATAVRAVMKELIAA